MLLLTSLFLTFPAEAVHVLALAVELAAIATPIVGIVIEWRRKPDGDDGGHRQPLPHVGLPSGPVSSRA
ncbi:MAG TPA: hypothetical protein VHM00_19145 [Caldimonas sp.]|jgi:hypothetical protein|nr:hypothetical protein [Caldimonas sp.]HEX2543186.1 hypothetical protein [Caldimonas sp.]